VFIAMGLALTLASVHSAFWVPMGHRYGPAACASAGSLVIVPILRPSFGPPLARPGSLDICFRRRCQRFPPAPGPGHRPTPTIRMIRLPGRKCLLFWRQHAAMTPSPAQR
jgi:hypothetical protein